MSNIDQASRVIELLNSPSWLPIRHFFKFLSYPADKVLLEQGLPAKGLYVVTTGRVELSIESDTGAKIVVDVLDGVGHFGEVALIDDGTGLVTARTLDDVNVIYLGKEYFQALRVGFPGVAFELMTMMCFRGIEKLAHMRGNLIDAVKLAPKEIQDVFTSSDEVYQDVCASNLKLELQDDSLLSLPSMNHFSGDECGVLSDYFDTVSIEAGLFKQDDHDSLFLLYKGSAQLEHVERGVCLRFPIMNPGHVFAVERFLNVYPLTSTLHVCEPSEFIQFTATRLCHLQVAHPEVYAKMQMVVVRSVARRLRVMHQYLVSVSDKYDLEYRPVGYS